MISWKPTCVNHAEVKLAPRMHCPPRVGVGHHPGWLRPARARHRAEPVVATSQDGDCLPLQIDTERFKCF
jgi:hypothetical protein